jgi:ubiquinone/menaquinone biosynthesis C-methylase UbiE
MTAMSSIEAAFCRSAPWRGFARYAILPWALQGQTVGPDVLEIGAGSGAMAYELIRREPAIRLTAADVDPAMVAAAEARLQPYADRATAVQADAGNLDFPDHSFDTVCTWLMLHHTIDWPSVLTEATRVLRPGGTLIGYDLTDSAPSRLIHRADRSEHRMIAAADLRSGLGATGLQDVTVEPAWAGLTVRFRGLHPS